MLTDSEDTGFTTAANRAALLDVAAQAERAEAGDFARIRSVLDAARLDIDVEALVAAVGTHVTVTMNFHPDRSLAGGRSVAEALCEEGVYRSQFETGISGGGLSAQPGGDRDLWEHSLFAGAYQRPGVHASERPKYGGLNLMNNLNGACPRFGSCHLRLKPETTERATLVFGDSNAKPTGVGLRGAFAPVLAPLLEVVATGDHALGRQGVGVTAFVEGLVRGDHNHARGTFAPMMSHALNDYIEAQVHGELRLARDVEAVVIDPAFQGTESAAALHRAASAHGFGVEWHNGVALPLTDVPRDAPDAPEPELMRWQVFCAKGRASEFAMHVVREVGSGPSLDAKNIGQAANSVVRDPARWRHWGEPPQVLVNLKDLWLMVAALGQPMR